MLVNLSNEQVATIRDELEYRLDVMSNEHINKLIFPEQYVKEEGAIRSALAALDTPATPKPDWSSAPEWAEWWAIDASGKGYWYEFEPGETWNEWIVKEGRYRVAALPPFEWKLTLTPRPKR